MVKGGRGDGLMVLKRSTYFKADLARTAFELLCNGSRAERLQALKAIREPPPRQRLGASPIPHNALRLSRKLDECKTLVHGSDRRGRSV